MSPEFIDQIVSLLQKHSLAAFEFEQGDSCLSVKMNQSPQAHSISDAPLAPNSADGRREILICSPGMGVVRFLHPERSEPFVTVGSDIRQGQIVAVLENGAVLSEVIADQSGSVIAALQEDGAIVGFASPLLSIRRT